METKRLTRSRSDRMVAGVAGGLAAYMGLDPLFVRLGFLFLSLLNGLGLLLYLALWLLTPNEDSVTADARAQVRENATEMREAAEQLVQRIRGAFTPHS
ncbi:MAG TPA: PspC domain-containing protein [Roseiflexaceae bacterium]|nr:PspC domain-containing protein [Roseiflexaceae bacterium]